MSALFAYLYLLQFSNPPGSDGVALNYSLEALQIIVTLVWALHPLVSVQAVCSGWMGMNQYAWFGIMSLYFVGTYQRGTILHAYNLISAWYYLWYALAADVESALAWPVTVSTWEGISAVPTLPSSYWSSLARTWTARILHPPSSVFIPHGWEERVGQQQEQARAGSSDLVHMLQVLAVASACALALSQALVWLTLTPTLPATPGQGEGSLAATHFPAAASSQLTSPRDRQLRGASGSSSSASEVPSNPRTTVHTSPPSSLAGFLPSPPPQAKAKSPARATVAVPGSASSLASYASVAASGGRKRAGSTTTGAAAGSRAGKVGRPRSNSGSSRGRVGRAQGTGSGMTGSITGGTGSLGSSESGGSSLSDYVPATPASHAALTSPTAAALDLGSSTTPPPLDLVGMYHTGLLQTVALLLIHDLAHACYAAAQWRGGAGALHQPSFTPAQLYVPLACGALLSLFAVLRVLQQSVTRTGGTGLATLYLAVVTAGLAWITVKRTMPLASTWSDPVQLWDAVVHTKALGTDPLVHLAYARALAAAGGNASMLALAMAHYESARSLAASPVLFPQPSIGLSELTLSAFVNATAALTMYEAGTLPVPARGEEAAMVLQAGYTEAWEAAVHSHKAVVQALSWSVEGSGHVLEAEEVALREAVCGAVGTATVPTMEQVQRLKQGRDTALQHAQGFSNAGNLLALAASRSSTAGLGAHVGGGHQVGSETLEAWSRAATLLALHTLSHTGGRTEDVQQPELPGSTLSASDIALSLGDNLHTTAIDGVQHGHGHGQEQEEHGGHQYRHALAGRVYELGLQAAAADGGMPAMSLLQRVTAAILVREHGSRSGGDPLALPFVYAPASYNKEGGTDSEASPQVEQLASFHLIDVHQAGVVKAVRWQDPSHPLLSKTTALAAQVEQRTLPPPVCIEHRVGGVKGIRASAPATLYTYERAVAELRALLVSSPANATIQDEAWLAQFLETAPVCSTAQGWETDCGKMLILANRAATVAAEAVRLARRGSASSDPTGSCTCASVSHGGQGGDTEHAAPAPGAARTVRMCAHASTTVPAEPSVLSASTTASILGLHPLSSPSSSCSRVDGIRSMDLPSPLAGWMHCVLEEKGRECGSTETEAAFARALASLLPLHRTGVSLARALVLSARAHALTLLAVRYNLPGAPRPPITVQAALAQTAAGAVNSTSPAGRSLVQALHASRAGLAMLTEDCACA